MASIRRDALDEHSSARSGKITVVGAQERARSLRARELE